MKMHALIATPQALNSNRYAAAVRGLSALGITWDETPSDRARYDFALCSGMRNNSKAVRDWCVRRSIPLMIAELGYLKRSFGNHDNDGYFQLGWNRIGWVPDQAPPDRWEALGLRLQPLRNNHAGPVLVLGQVGFDAQHNRSSHELADWLSGMAAKAKARSGGRVVYRPHPLQPSTRLVKSIVGGYVTQDPKSVSLDAALDQACCAVTFNSTAGVEAMLKGVPVLCHASAHFHSVCGPDTPEELRLDYMHRLAYAQWNLEELESGLALRYLLKLD